MIENNLTVTDLDFQDIKKNLIDHFENTETGFTDWDFEGSNLNTVIDLLAYNTHYNAMLAHMAVNESFIDSAQLRSSVVSASKLLGYIPRSYSSSKVQLDGVFDIPVDGRSSAPTIFNMTRGSIFSTTYNETPFSFVVLDDNIPLTKVGNTYVTDSNTPIIAYEGRIVKHRLTSNASDDSHRYEIPDENIDISTLKVRIYDSSSSVDGTATEFTQVNLSQVNKESTIYFLNENTFGNYEITFGNGVFGQKLIGGNIIELEYLITKGEIANGANSDFTYIPTSGPSTYVGSQISMALHGGTRASGGARKESLERLKQNAINSFTTQGRAVTADDYKNLILSNFQFVQSVSVWGGEDANPPEYGKVFISAKPYPKGDDEEDLLTPTDKKNILDYLDGKKVLAIIPEIVDPNYVNIVLDVMFKYNPNITSQSVSEIQTSIRDTTLQSYVEDEINTFDTIFRHSHFVRLIDNHSRAIMNSLVRVFVQQTISIPDTIDESGVLHTDFTVDFGVPLALDNGNVVVNTSTSKIWYENGERVYISDEEGRMTNIRNVYLYRLVNGVQVKIRDIGSINIDTGIMNLISVYTDTALNLKLTVNPKSNDIVGKRNFLLRIDESATTIRGQADEIASGGTSRAVDYQPFDKDRI